jgi:LacI family transcriptional regulator, galactose operon repressor
MRQVTIRDVAAEAGVSVGTASKALNGQGKLRAETRERVAEAAERLGFAPNTLAQALLAGRSFTVGLITTDSFGRFSIPVMLGAEDALGTGQVSVFMCDTRDDPERERRYTDMLAARRVDGLIITGRRIEPRPPVMAGHGIPVVYAMTQPTEGDGPSVLPDDEGGGRAATEHLIVAGRRQIAHITGPHRFLAARKRAAGFSAALMVAGMTTSGDVRFGEWSEAWGRDEAARLLADEPEVDAIFCGSDQIARGVADTLRAAGRRIPDDIAIVGFDNWGPMVIGAQPPLTSVDMCLEEVGRTAAGHLLAAIAGTPAHGVHTVPARLVVRESSMRANQSSELQAMLPGRTPVSCGPDTPVSAGFPRSRYPAANGFLRSRDPAANGFLRSRYPASRRFPAVPIPGKPPVPRGPDTRQAAGSPRSRYPAANGFPRSRYPAANGFLRFRYPAGRRFPAAPRLRAPGG